jgi:signal transduction histidine kinase
MLVSEGIKQLQEDWVARVSQKLGKSEWGRQYITEELERFFGLLIQAVESGDPGWLNPLLIDWAGSRTETDLESDEVTLSPVLNVIMEEMVASAKENLPEEDALSIVEALLPIFHYSYENIAQHEILVRVGYISAKLEKIQRELSRLDRSKSDFIAVAAHELKTPLTLIEGYTSMLGDITSKSSDESAGMLIDGIGKGIQRLGEIINDMIDVSMIDNDLLSLSFQPIWLNRIFEALQKEVQPHVENRNQNLIVEDFPGSDEMIFADTERIYQALRNVLTNAIKYTPDGGTIHVDGRLLSDFVEIRVKDEGIGIAPENQTRIFEKFSSLGDTMTHSSSKVSFKGGGPGLGLPITRGILEAHGGSIWVESDGYDEENFPGCMFHILLPMRKEPPDEQVAKLFNISEDEKP